MQISRDRRWLIVGLTLLLCTPLGACKQRPADSPATSKVKSDLPAVSSATLAYTGNARGFQRPCGCNTHQNGGLLRLGSALHEVRRVVGGIALPEGAPSPYTREAERKPVTSMGVESPHGDSGLYPPADLDPQQAVWLVDLGNFSDPGARNPGLRAHTHLQALAELHADCVVLGGAELQLSAADASASLGKSDLVFVSCNATADPRKLAGKGVQTQRTYSLAANWVLIGVTTQLSSNAAESSWATLADPVESVKFALAQIPTGTNVIVAAAQLPVGLARELATLPVAAVIGFDIRQDPQWPEGLARTLPPPPPRGLELRLASLLTDKAQAWSVLLDDLWADDPEISDLLVAGQAAELEAVQAALQNKDPDGLTMKDKFLPPELRKDGLASLNYIGSTNCQSCHSTIHTDWAGTKHAQALATLTNLGEATTPDCLSCHTVGFGETDGYLPSIQRPELAGVGCENCHGPGGKHAAAMAAQPPPPKEEWAIERGTLSTCLNCHDEYNSPRFEPETYWAKIHTELR